MNASIFYDFKKAQIGNKKYVFFVLFSGTAFFFLLEEGLKRIRVDAAILLD